MNERDRPLLDDIVEFCDRAIRPVAGRTHDNLGRDEAALYAVGYCIQVVGGASQGLSPEAKAAIPAIPWRQITAMRHGLVHGYAAIDESVVHGTVAEDLPFLAETVRRHLTAGAG